MPYRTGSTPFTGDDDMADFLVDVWIPFATDSFVAGGLAWISQSPDGGAPPGGGGTHPNYQRMVSRGGVGTEAPPFINFQTSAKTLFIFSGTDVNTGQEPYDQPGNPQNGPIDAVFGDPGHNIELQCAGLTTMVGPFDSYWLFGGPSAEYLHCVIKVSARQYRHFHVGMITPLDPDLHADSFYITQHRWNFLEPDNFSMQQSGTVNSLNSEHQPYQSGHIMPFRNNGTGVNVAVGQDFRQSGLWLYSPGYGTEAYDWWMAVGTRRCPDASGGGGGTSVPGRAQNVSQPASTRSVIATTKVIGDVNEAADDVLFGAAFVSGYDATLGTVPWACEPTFVTDGVPLIPIYVGLPTDFESALRWGPVAQVPDVFRVNMKNLDAEEEITVGSDTYIVFPMINKDSANTLDNEGYSGYEGLAYKKITADAS
jgi:hypothetical protein